MWAEAIDLHRRRDRARSPRSELPLYSNVERCAPPSGSSLPYATSSSDLPKMKIKKEFILATIGTLITSSCIGLAVYLLHIYIIFPKLEEAAIP
uniref:Essential MCU regulator, mitochondrial n=1 Tax=Steinernema glaseri TaxID=37863 RepID=A0A1I7Y1Y8_9BILA